MLEAEDVDFADWIFAGVHFLLGVVCVNWRLEALGNAIILLSFVLGARLSLRAIRRWIRRVVREEIEARERERTGADESSFDLGE